MTADFSDAGDQISTLCGLPEGAVPYEHRSPSAVDGDSDNRRREGARGQVGLVYTVQTLCLD